MHTINKALTSMTTLLLIAVSIVACAVSDAELEKYFPAEPDPLIGDYIGRWNDDIDIDPKVAAQVIALGSDKYRVKIISKLDMRAPIQLDTEATAKRGKLSFEDGRYFGEIKNGVFTGGRGKKEVFKMEKVVRLSPNLNLAPPSNATVLFDGKNFENFTDPTGWEILDDGVFMVTPNSGYLETKQGYRDLRVHLEFRLAHMPKARGQNRSNSGLFVGDEYEVQILDSYGLEGVYDECGALYKVAAPKVNAAAPPLQWQSYDLIYRAPRYDANGTLTANPRMSVLHNGVPIHTDTEMKWLTGWKEVDRMAPHTKDPGKVKLQGHGNYVQFRNFWLIDLGQGGEASF